MKKATDKHYPEWMSGGGGGGKRGRPRGRSASPTDKKPRRGHSSPSKAAGGKLFTPLQSQALEKGAQMGMNAVKFGKWRADLLNMKATFPNKPVVRIVRNGDGTWMQLPCECEEDGGEEEDEDEEGTLPASPPSPKKKPASSLPLPTDTPACLFAGEHLSPSSISLLSEMLVSVPRIVRRPLKDAARLMLPKVRAWLTSLGRAEGESGMAITLEEPLDAHPTATPYPIAKKFKIKGKDLQDLAASARITVLEGALPPGKPVTIPEDLQLSPKQCLEAKSVMVSGPVHVVFGNSYQVKPRSPPVLACSVPGINFQYSPEDLSQFTTQTGKLRSSAVTTQMKQIWAHVFEVMMDGGVEYPVLCAIGCGEFKGPYVTVPRYWAAALVSVLLTNVQRYNFKCVIVSLPTFADDNYTAFEGELKRFDLSTLTIPVLLVEDFSMVTLADFLASKGSSAGILNPSDQEAVRKGWIGMYWDGGHIALEEVLALQTTMLLHHKSLNPSLWEQPPDFIKVRI